MPIPYLGNYFYPPRSEVRVPYTNVAKAMDSTIAKMWKRFPDAIAQWKMNGTNTQLKITPQGKIELWTRHRLDANNKPSPDGLPSMVKDGKIKLYVLPKAMQEEILDLTPRGVYTIYNVELLHSKTKQVKDVLYFFDVLVWKGQHLLGVEYKERHGIIDGVLGRRDFPLDLAKTDGMIYVAQNMAVSEWDAAWMRAQSCDYCEGLVLKRTGAVSRLTHGNQVLNNGGFLCRIRKPTKNARY